MASNGASPHEQGQMTALEGCNGSTVVSTLEVPVPEDSDDDIVILECDNEEVEETAVNLPTYEFFAASQLSATCSREDDEEQVDDQCCHTVSDDDDDDVSMPVPKTMLCYRCFRKKDGLFTDLDKFRTHVQRHTFPDHFNCIKCKRPFVTMSECLSHELRVHGTPIPNGYDNDTDEVIRTAKEYVNNLARRKEEGAGLALEHDDVDMEDVRFYGNRFCPSGAYYPYRGPEVENWMECYEIQFYSEKQKSRILNFFAKLAIDRHRANVLKGHDKYKLGRFGAPKVLEGHAEGAWNSDTGGRTEEKPKKKKIPEDSVSVPRVKKMKSPKKSRVKQNSANRKAVPVFSSACLQRKCLKCSFEWETPEDMRKHRNEVHPGSSMLELMAQGVRQKFLDQEFKKRLAQQGNTSTDGSPKQAKAQNEEKSDFFKRSRSVVPLPDASFTDKEKFLYNFNLVNRVRLGLHQKKSLEDLKLPECSVMTRKLSDTEIETYMATLKLESFFQPHFLSEL